MVIGDRQADAVDDGARRFFPTGLIQDVSGFHPGGIEFALSGNERDPPERAERHDHVGHEDTASTVMRNAVLSSSARWICVPVSMSQLAKVSILALVLWTSEITSARRSSS